MGGTSFRLPCSRVVLYQVDPFGDGDLDVVDAAPVPVLGEDVTVADQLGLERPVERLPRKREVPPGGGVVVRISFATNGGNDFGVLEPFGISALLNEAW